ncbi:MAG: hypothetical protein MPW14_19395 [Candidatus Manganitrophus sp.]|nr:MAG: hypothetical protein MPW14_19395 [Candidatus Manganitrophus sp.]
MARLLRDERGKRIGLLAPLVVNRKGFYTDLAKWAKGQGLTHLRVDGEFPPVEPWPRLDRFKEHTIELPVGEMKVQPSAEAELRALLARALAFGKGVVQIAPLGEDVLDQARLRPLRQQLPRARSAPVLLQLQARLVPDAATAPESSCRGSSRSRRGRTIWWNAWWEGAETTCPACEGKRLNPEALAVRFRKDTIAGMAALPVEAAERFFRDLKLKGRDAEIARDLLAEIRSRLAFLEQVGLGYLALDRAAPTLSGGEAQRIRLAAQLGSNLRGVCYILDEPTIGLHPRDNRLLLDTLHELEAKGNTLVVVEHDEDTIRRADHVIDLGPGAGTQRRAGGGPGHRGRADAAARIGHRALPGRAAAASADRAEAAAQRGGAAPDDRRRPAAQPEETQDRSAAPAARLRSPASPARASARWRATCCTPT